MTAVYRDIIDHPSAWTAAELGGREPLTYRFSAAELAAIDEALNRTRQRGVHELVSPEFGHPVLDALMPKVQDIVLNGRGLIILSGIERGRYTDEELERIYWGLGTHLGIGVVQSVYGDMMGYVEANENDPYARAYRSTDELRYHCDTQELVGLMCLQTAPEGGLSLIASTLAIHNEIFRRRPDLLDALYEGYYLAPSELQHSERPVTDVKTPIYCYRDGLVSCTYGAAFITRAAAVRGEELPPKLADAMRLFTQIASDPAFHLSFHLQPGEIMLWQNFTNVHSRTEFKNSDTQKRKLLRLWLKPNHPRPVDPRFFSRAEAYLWYYHEQAKVGKAG
jgi:hypothetical protein